MKKQSGYRSTLAVLRRGFSGDMSESLWSALAIAASLLVVIPLIMIAGEDPLAGYETLIKASFGSAQGFAVMLQFSVPLILIGLGVAIPLRIGLFNIGGEGQLAIGALFAVFVGVKLSALSSIPAVFVLPLAAGFLGGALIGSIAGALKAWRGINEIITTIMLNFIALLFVTYWVTGAFRDEALSYAASPAIDPGFALARIGASALPSSFFVALVIVAVIAVAVHFTSAGWRLRLGGINPALAERQGSSVRRMQFVALLIGGGLAGLGGAAEAIGNQQRIGEAFSPGWGFDAIAIAILARGNMLAVIPYAIFFAFLRNGAGVLQTDLNVPGAIVIMLSAIPVILVAAILGYRFYRGMRMA